MIVVEQCSDGFELRINNVAFSDIHNPCKQAVSFSFVVEHKSASESYSKNSSSYYANPTPIVESEKPSSHTQKEYKTPRHVSGKWGDVQKAAHMYC